MPKKIDEAEVKKECPSCGLGVSLESTTCEFCGWDFDEEDEWILQIEKLERDLMLEKQKFEPGTVNEKIESTLHSPTLVMKESAKSATKTAPEAAPKGAAPAPKRGRAAETKKPMPTPEPVIQEPASTRPTTSRPAPEAASAPIAEKPAPARRAYPEPVITRAAEPAPKETPSSSVRRVRVVKSVPIQEAKEASATKRRLVRKVKERS